MRKILKVSILATTLLGYSNLYAFCDVANDLPKGVSNLIDIFGAVPEEDAPKIVKQIQATGKATSTLNTINQLCGVIKDKDPFTAYLFALNQLSSISDIGIAPFISIMTEMAGKEVEAIKYIANKEAFYNIQAPSTVKFKVSIQSYQKWWWNEDLSDSDVSKKINLLSLVYSNGVSGTDSYFIDTDPSSNSFAYANIDDGTAPIEKSPFLRVIFNNGQTFYIPIDKDHVNTPNTTTFIAPFTYKNSAYYYSK